MNNEEIFENIAKKHKIYVRRPWWEVAAILAGLLALCAVVVLPVVTFFAAAGARVVNHNYSKSYIEADRQGATVYTVTPKNFRRNTEYVQPMVSYFWGLVNVSAGGRELRYYLVVTLEDGTEFQAEVNQPELQKIGVFDGLEIDYVIGRYSGRYYITAVRVGDAQKNGLAARFWRSILPGSR